MTSVSELLRLRAEREAADREWEPFDDPAALVPCEFERRNAAIRRGRAHNAYHAALTDDTLDAMFTALEAASWLYFIEGLPSEDCDADCQGCAHPERCEAMRALAAALALLFPEDVQP